MNSTKDSSLDDKDDRSSDQTAILVGVVVLVVILLVIVGLFWVLRRHIKGPSVAQNPTRLDGRLVLITGRISVYHIMTTLTSDALCYVT